MIIYCHCTRDSALLLSFLLTCHPYFPFSFHEMIFILVDCELNNVIFGARSQFKRVDWNQSVFHCVNVSGLSVCGGEMVGWGSGEECNDHNVSDEMVTMTEGGNVSCDGVKDVKVECEALNEDTSLYRDLFIVAAAAVPGNIASAIAVFFMRRNYWMG